MPVDWDPGGSSIELIRTRNQSVREGSVLCNMASPQGTGAADDGLGSIHGSIAPFFDCPVPLAHW